MNPLNEGYYLIVILLYHLPVSCDILNIDTRTNIIYCCLKF